MPGSRILLPVKIDNLTLLVEAMPAVGSESTSSRVDRARDAVTDAFDHAQAAIVAVASSTVTTIKQLGQQGSQPDGLEIKFGLKFTAKGGVVVAGASGEAALEIILKYDGRYVGATMTETPTSEA